MVFELHDEVGRMLNETEMTCLLSAVSSLGEEV